MPALAGLIERRVLVNYRVDAAVLRRSLPAPFRPHLVDGFGIAGVCLIRLARVRPRFLPAFFGLGSENAAHRVAVEWDTETGVQRGVYVPRRDTSSWVNVAVGGSLFPGEQHRAVFESTETEADVQIKVRSTDGATRIEVAGSVAPSLPEGSVFESTEAASAFFECGSLGYSATADPGRFDGLELCSSKWQVEPLAARHEPIEFDLRRQ